MIDLGILNKADDKLELLLPVVEKSEYMEEKKLAGEYKEKISGNIHNIMEALHQLYTYGCNIQGYGRRLALKRVRRASSGFNTGIRKSSQLRTKLKTFKTNYF